MKNSVQLIGHVGQDPEIKHLEGGKKLAHLTLATNEVYYRENGDKVEKTEWHKVMAWGKTAEIIERFVTKGKEVAVEGKLTHRSYDDKDGNKRFITEVVVNELLLLSKQNMMQVRLFTIRLSSTYLEQDQLSLNSFLETVQFKKSSTQFVEQEEGYWSVLIYYEYKESQELEKEGVQFQNLDEQQQRVLAFLKQWRTEKALALRVKNFMICRNSELIDLALNRPSTLSELERIKGFGKQKIDRFGEELVTLLNAV